MTKLFAPCLAALFLLSSSFLRAQSICGTPSPEQHYRQASPEGKRRIDAQARITERLSNQHAAKTTNNVITIPVVIHSVYKTFNQKVTPATAQAQINALNRDFRLQNSDAQNIPTAFQPLAADIEIEFCLAKRDPNGCATNGITYTQSANDTWNLIDVKKSSAGGIDPWDPSQYLNVWVCDIEGSTLGYGTFPGGDPDEDGIVIDITAFGPGDNAVSPFDLGRTLVHEAGHWLDLRHIWGSSNLIGSQSCTDSDLADDTPNQYGPNTDCPDFPSYSCPDEPNGDMFMNYMDYTNDACRLMFTQDQKTRMRALFEPGGARVSLLNSPGCQPGCSSTVTVSNITGVSGLCLAETRDTGSLYVTVTDYKPECMRYNWSITPENGGLKILGESIGMNGQIRVLLQAFQQGAYTVSFSISNTKDCGDYTIVRTYQVSVCDLPAALPDMPPFGMDYICTDQEECYTFPANGCLTGLSASTSDLWLTVTTTGTTICLESRVPRQRNATVLLNPTNQCGSGPTSTWTIHVDDPAHCRDGGLHKPGPSTAWTELSATLKITGAGRQIKVWETGPEPPIETAEKNIQVFNLEGRLLFESKTADRQSTIDLSAQPAGIYVVRVTQGKEIAVSRVMMN